jgi:hypothetical protein
MNANILFEALAVTSLQFHGREVGSSESRRVIGLNLPSSAFMRGKMYWSTPVLIFS